MKRIKLSELVIGQRIADTEASKYGQMVNRVVASIQTTKSGRINMKFTYDYLDAEGNLKSTGNLLSYSNGAISPNTLVTLF